MNVLVLTGSPRKNGTTARLAAAFIEGAEKAGHTVERRDSALMKVSPCRACYACRKNGGHCVIEDDMAPLLGGEGLLLAADAIVLVTPIYYFGMTAQLKTVLDRMYALGRRMRKREQQLLFLVAAGDSEPSVLNGLYGQGESLRQWTHWRDGGTLAALGCHEPGDLDATDYLQKAFAMGYELS